MLSAYEGIQIALEVIGTETQLFLALQLPVLVWMFKGRVFSTHYATDATWSKWVALITQAHIRNPSHPGILEVIMDWPEGKDFEMSPEKEIIRAEEALLYNKLTESEKQYALFTDGSCHLCGKASEMESSCMELPTSLKTAEGEGELSHFAEVKAIQVAINIAE